VAELYGERAAPVNPGSSGGSCPLGARTSRPQWARGANNLPLQLGEGRGETYATTYFLRAPPAPHIAVRLCLTVANIKENMRRSSASPPLNEGVVNGKPETYRHVPRWSRERRSLAISQIKRPRRPRDRIRPARQLFVVTAVNRGAS